MDLPAVGPEENQIERRPEARQEGRRHSTPPTWGNLKLPSISPLLVSSALLGCGGKLSNIGKLGAIFSTFRQLYAVLRLTSHSPLPVVRTFPYVGKTSVSVSAMPLTGSWLRKRTATESTTAKHFTTQNTLLKKSHFPYVGTTSVSVAERSPMPGVATCRPRNWRWSGHGRAVCTTRRRRKGRSVSPILLWKVCHNKNIHPPAIPWAGPSASAARASTWRLDGGKRCGQ